MWCFFLEKVILHGNVFQIVCSNGRLWNARWQQTYLVNFHCLRSSKHGTLSRTMDLPGESAATKRLKSLPLQSILPAWGWTAGARYSAIYQKRCYLLDLLFVKDDRWLYAQQMLYKNSHKVRFCGWTKIVAFFWFI